MKRIIIIVEDDTVVGSVYQTQLSREGFAVEVVTDGAAGLARIQEVCPDAVVLDLMLPRMSGVDVLKKIRAQPELAKVPVMVFTNAYVPVMVDDAMQAGATQVFNKANVTPREIVLALKNAGCFAKDACSDFVGFPRKG